MKTTTSQSKTAEKSIEDLFVDELQDMYDVEKRLVKTLPKMAKTASTPDLREAIEGHLRETEGHVEKVEKIFAMLDMTPKAKKCEAMVGILEEGDGIVGDFKGSQAIDAAVICAAQKVEHYEIATYGCLQEWAGMLGHDDVSGIFEEILAEEKACDVALTEIARGVANEMAQSGEDESEEEDEDEMDDEDSGSSRKGGRRGH